MACHAMQCAKLVIALTVRVCVGFAGHASLDLSTLFPSPADLEALVQQIVSGVTNIAYPQYW